MPAYLDWPSEHAPSVADEYDRYAEVYDLLLGGAANDLAFYEAVAAEVLSPEGELLELGTGTGRVADRMVAAGFRVTGVDLSPAMLAVARTRRGALEGRFEPVLGDVRAMRLPRRFGLAIAPYGMMAHLCSEADRLATMRSVFEHLAPGGAFVFDDRPTWLSGASSGGRFELLGTAVEPGTQTTLRLLRTTFDVVGEPLTVIHDVVDWLAGDRVARRLVVRMVARNTPLEDELRLLREAGFGSVELFGGFDGRPFDRDAVARNERFIVRCRRPD